MFVRFTFLSSVLNLIYSEQLVLLYLVQIIFATFFFLQATAEGIKPTAVGLWVKCSATVLLLPANNLTANWYNACSYFENKKCSENAAQ